MTELCRRVGMPLAAVAVGWGAMTGCTFSRQRINTVNFHEKVQQVVEGQTTADELAATLGSPPQSVLYTDNGKRIYVYSFGDAKTAGLTLIVFNSLKTNMGLDGAMFLIDQNGVVEEFIVSNHSQDIPWEWWAFDEDQDG